MFEWILIYLCQSVEGQSVEGQSANNIDGTPYNIVSLSLSVNRGTNK